MQTIEKQPVCELDVELARAVRFHQDGHLLKAGKIYQTILDREPNHADTLCLAGMLAHQMGDDKDAVELVNKAIHIFQGNPRYHSHLGAEMHHQLARIMEDLGKLDEALDCYRKALEIQPNRADAYSDMGLVFRQQGKFAEALSSLQKAVEIDPGGVEAHNNLGILFQENGRLELAVECYHKALATQPNFVNAYTNLGMACQGMGKSEEAVACFRKAIEIRPDYDSAFRHLVRQLQKDCAWSQMQAPAAGLDRLTKVSLGAGARPAEDPFLNLTRHPDPAYNLNVARAWSTDIRRRMADVKPGFSFDNRRCSTNRITIGYLSHNFHDHPMAHLLLGLFRLQNRDKFKINCYSCGKKDDSYYRRRIRLDCDKFVDLRDISHLEAARAIYNDRVDILIDLMGHTRGSRMEICALRPAPIQVRYLGLAGTTGADFFDYILTDKIVTPEAHAPYYSEKFAYLPHCYQINDYKQTNGDDNSVADEPDLPADRFVFCSFSQDYKIEPVMFNCWMQILRRVPESVLWLMVRHKAAVENLRIEAGARGINPDRLVFVERQARSDHLARLRKADLALDTRIVNGAATTSDALWAGVPVITLKGTHFASRMSASILTAVGLPELIAHSIDEYEAIAVQTASDHDKLAELRQKLAQNRLSEPLFDTPCFVKNLEQVYSRMWQIFQAGSKPRQFEVTESPSAGGQNLKPELNPYSPAKEKDPVASMTGAVLRGGSDDISQNSLSMSTEPEISVMAGIHPTPPAKRIAFFCGPNDSFLKDICNRLAENHEVRRFDGKTVQDMQDLMKWSDLSWFEWCDQLVIQASMLPKVCRLICRLHRYEIFTDLPGQVDWKKIDDLIFVAPHIRDIAISKIPNLEQNVRTHIIHNGIDLDKYCFSERSNGFNIAYIGYIHHRKNPSLLLQCLRYLVDTDDRYILHIAGEHQEMGSKLYFDHMVKAMELEPHVKFYGWVNDIVQWLRDKQYILSTSLHESFGYGIAEAMACGLKPLIHNFICAQELYPEKYCFNSIKEFDTMVLCSDYHSGEYRKYIEDNYSLAKQLQEIEILLGTCPHQKGEANLKAEPSRGA